MPEVRRRESGGGWGVIRAEWIKLRSIPRWSAGLLGAALLTVAVSVLIASGSSAEFDGEEPPIGPDGQAVSDDFHFVHQKLAGDGTLTARVLTQTAVDADGKAVEPQEWAKAGVMIKESADAGSPYASIMATPGHGVRMQANFNTDIAGEGESSPRWLRLVRDGSTINGFESADGSDWRDVGSVTLEDLPDTVEAGFFVGSSEELIVEREAGSTSAGTVSTLGIATFDNVELSGSSGAAQGEWAGDDIGNGWSREPASEDDGVYTVTGSGDIGELVPDDDVVQMSQFGVVVGSLAIIAICTLFVTSEYRRGMIRTTFTAVPRRASVLTAKAAVAAAAVFVIGLAATAAAFFLAQPVLRDNGLAPPRFPEPSLSDPSVLRALLGSAAILAVIAVLAIGVGVIVRRSAAAIAVVTTLFFVPAFLTPMLPPDVSEWLVRLTPTSGLAMQRALEPTNALVEPWAMIEPWVGFGVLCLYAAVAMGGAFWMLRRRDV